MDSLTARRQRSLAITAIRRLMPMHHDYVLPDGTHTRTSPPIDYPECMIRAIGGMITGIEEKDRFRVLDIGCNAGWVTRYMAKKGAIAHGIDIVDRYLEQAMAIEAIDPTSACFWGQDFREMPDDNYDGIFFMGVIYHMEDYGTALGGVRRLLSENGWLIAETACASKTRVYLGKDGDVYAGDPSCRWIPSPDDFIELAKSSGFEVADSVEWMSGRFAAKLIIP